MKDSRFFFYFGNINKNVLLVIFLQFSLGQKQNQKNPPHPSQKSTYKNFISTKLSSYWPKEKDIIISPLHPQHSHYQGTHNDDSRTWAKDGSTKLQHIRRYTAKRMRNVIVKRCNDGEDSAFWYFDI